MQENNINLTSADERSLQFVARHYRQGAFDAGQAWSKLDIPCTSSYYRRRVIAIAAAVIVIVGSAFVIRHLINSSSSLAEPHPVTLACNDANTTYLLPDDSRVTLTRGAKLTYDMSTFAEKRDITLDGRAFFDVTHNESSPFTVNTDVATVTVLGTRFAVDDESQSTIVQVQEGKVEVTCPSGTATLERGTMAIATDSALKVQAIDDVNAFAWVDGNVEFDNMPLSKIAGTIERVYRVTVTGLPKNDPSLTLYFKGDAQQLVNEINSLLGTQLKIADNAQ